LLKKTEILFALTQIHQKCIKFTFFTTNNIF
jgi:hypothetical protein